MKLLTLLMMLALFAFGMSQPRGNRNVPNKEQAKRKWDAGKYIHEKSTQEGVIRLKSGLLVEIIKSAEDSQNKNPKSPLISSKTKVTYSGTFTDGRSFDSGTLSFAPNQVIRGWTEAMQLMAEGDVWRLHLPYQLAYGDRGAGGRIPPYSPLVFLLEIHKVEGQGKSLAEARAMFKDHTMPPDGGAAGK
jgi:FKBP-type peptidyl-prolyl cis-trans isomerase FklB